MQRTAIALCILGLGFPPGGATAQSTAARDSALHALNRLAYGPRPGEVDAVATRGVLRWIDAQLDPQRVGDDELDRVVRGTPLARIDRADLARQ